MLCRSCGYENRAGSVYCGRCRAALTRPCRVCGEPAPVGAVVCPACGASLTADAPLADSPSSNPPAEPAAAYHPQHAARAAPATGRSRSAQGEGTRFTGVVRDVQQREIEEGRILDFRIERHDPSGDQLAIVPVEMRGAAGSFSGTVSNGDEIRVANGEWQDGTLRVEQLDNLTTGARVRVKSYRRVLVVLLVAFLIPFLSGMGFVVYLFVIHVILGRPG
jgi:hypothetical protein